MKIFKFGGASVKDAKAVKNVFQIIKGERENLAVVISAMGSSTNLLETLIKAYFNKKENAKSIFGEFKNF